MAPAEIVSSNTNTKPHRTYIVWDYSWSHWDHWRYLLADFGRPT